MLARLNCWGCWDCCLHALTLSLQFKDLQEETRLQQRKGANAMKDLAKQLSQANRKVGGAWRASLQNLTSAEVADKR